MEYTSFYGGRRGTSFVIVKNYNTIHEMIVEFQQGASSINEVAYGEYVIIDSIDKNYEGHGCVYQRGLNYEEDEAVPENIEHPGGGARYIGQICGPDGKVKDLEIDKYLNVINAETEQKGDGFYLPSDMVPGKDGDTYNDDIKYAYANMKDIYGNVEKYLIGFRFPYLILEFESEPGDAYRPAAITRVDDKSHPFYEKWKVTIPASKKGNSFQQIKVYPTIVPEGAIYYNAVEGDTPVGPSSILTSIGTIVIEEYNPDNIYIKFRYDTSSVGYVNQNSQLENGNLWELHLGCYEVDYTTTPVGVKTWIDIGEQKMLRGTSLDSINGRLNIRYTAGGETANQVVPLKLIKDVTMDMTDDGDQKIHIHMVEDGQPEDKPIGDRINFIRATAIDNRNPDDSRFLIYYSDPEQRGSYSYGGLDQWTDLGNVKGKPGRGIAILGTVPTIDYLYDGIRPIPPEEMSPGHEGWCMIVESYSDMANVMFSYDYIVRDWKNINSMLNPENAVVISPEEEVPISLAEKGLQLISENRVGAY